MLISGGRLIRKCGRSSVELVPADRPLVMRPALFGTQSYHRIDFGGAPGRKVTGQQPGAN
jgi:hypothetical protein